MVDKKKIRGYGEGKADTVISVDDVVEKSSKIKSQISNQELLKLSNQSKFLEIKNLVADMVKWKFYITSV